MRRRSFVSYGDCRSLGKENKDKRDGTQALVVFVGETCINWLKILHPGFRHCFVAVRRQSHWVVCDPLCQRTDLLVLSGLTLKELSEWYRLHGLVVVETNVRIPPHKLAPLRPFTCVEAVKRILGIHAPWVLTPWQLYRHLDPTA